MKLQVDEMAQHQCNTKQNYIFSKILKLQKYRKKCSLCGDAIEGKFYIKDNNIICAKDYKVSQHPITIEI
jgi:hypothetical protein